MLRREEICRIIRAVVAGIWLWFNHNHDVQDEVKG